MESAASSVAGAFSSALVLLEALALLEALVLLEALALPSSDDDGMLLVLLFASEPSGKDELSAGGVLSGTELLSLGKDALPLSGTELLSLGREGAPPLSAVSDMDVLALGAMLGCTCADTLVTIDIVINNDKASEITRFPKNFKMPPPQINKDFR